MIVNPLLSIIIPLVGCILNGLFGSLFGRRGGVLITSFSLLTACLLA